MSLSQWLPRVRQFPPPNLRKSCPFHYRCIAIAGCRFFINFAYLHDAKTIMCQIARYTIDNDSNPRNITQPNRWWGFCLQLHTMINYNIHIMYLLMQSGSKLWVLQSPPPWNNTVLGVPILRNTYTIYTSKISKFCRYFPHSIIQFELSRPSPFASMSFSCWFSAFGSSPSLGTLWLLPSLCSLVGQSWW